MNTNILEQVCSMPGSPRPVVAHVGATAGVMYMARIEAMTFNQSHSVKKTLGTLISQS
jgi:hypothetical protein